MAEYDERLLNGVYMEISEQLGMETALEIYRMFKGQQITFPLRFLSRDATYVRVREEYDGGNVRTLAAKYGYSEKTIRRILKENKKEDMKP